MNQKVKRDMKQFKLVNNLMGWFTFIIAAVTYCLTIEPTASFWDCPEFITTAFKLEVGHPPGAPFFMLLGNFFTQFASDTSQVALMINTMSALLSATCILFLFWTITHLTRKLICKDGVVTTLVQLITIQGAGLVGALAFTWSDSFWFSAVEGEVYAFSSMFTALVFWLILKWEDNADKPHSDRWLVLIAYLTGLAIGVHLLNLLCIPAIVLIYYYKKNPNANLKGSLLALVVSFILVAVVLYGVVPGIVKIGGYFELLFVNQLGFGFNTGLIIYLILLVASVIWGIYESYVYTSHKRMIISTILSVSLLGIPFYGYGFSSLFIGGLVIAGLIFLLKYKKDGKEVIRPRFVNTAMLSLLMLMIGYSTYAVIVIRSTANTPMDQNSPEDIFTLGEYLSREQYGTRPLFYGQAYTSRVEFEETPNSIYLQPKRTGGHAIYQRKEKKSENEKDSYIKIGENSDLVYAQNMFFPRMFDSKYSAAYEDWMGGVEGHKKPYTDVTGRSTMVKMPTQLENLRFFISYQVNYMYWRYFFWNFVGRQNDKQGRGELEHGNWITGISFLDNLRIGDQNLLPDNLKNNKGHNVFYALPLLLGLLGLFWQSRKGKKGSQQFWVVFFLFFMTGIAIVLYLNQTPSQPRERDYAYTGSFYAFAIWIGLGVAALAEYLQRVKLSKLQAAIGAVVIALFIPIQMVSQTWDDHDRSGRYCCRDFGQNYLKSIQENGNPIIFCNGDNDTFPLWYNQEIEGFRTDARVCNLSYLQTDWYIDQMRRPAYDSPSVPISWNRSEYTNGNNEMVHIEPKFKSTLQQYAKEHPESNPFDLRFILDNFVRNKDIDARIIPTDSIVLPIDKEAVKRSGMTLQGDSIPDYMTISLKGKNALSKSQLMMLEMLAQTNWERPLYVAITVSEDNYFNLGNSFVQEGLAYRITPFATGGEKVDTEKMYDNMMHKFKYGGLKDHKDLYLDETTMRMCFTHRRMFTILAKALLKEGKKEKAIKVLKKCEEEIPSNLVPNTVYGGVIELAECYKDAGMKKEAMALYGELEKECTQYLTFINSLSNSRLRSYQKDFTLYLQLLMSIGEDYMALDSVSAKRCNDVLQGFWTSYTSRMGLPRR